LILFRLDHYIDNNYYTFIFASMMMGFCSGHLCHKLQKQNNTLWVCNEIPITTGHCNCIQLYCARIAFIKLSKCFEGPLIRTIILTPLWWSYHWGCLSCFRSWLPQHYIGLPLNDIIYNCSAKTSHNVCTSNTTCIYETSHQFPHAYNGIFQGTKLSNEAWVNDSSTRTYYTCNMKIFSLFVPIKYVMAWAN